MKNPIPIPIPHTFRELTVADLIEQLQGQPQHYPVSIIVAGMAGVITGVWVGSIESPSESYVLIGERETVPGSIPLTTREEDR